ncbi:MAG: hypothetical protein LBQ49_01285 [Rickettsiales bacterium]|jgi:hypothetical protein|nr:hypothetical protein [Rickettsiales bacterium]
MTAKDFFDLEKKLISLGHDSDLDSFAVIKERLKTKAPLSADEFARQAIYVVLAGGFSQKTAKKIHREVMDFLKEQVAGSKEQLFDSLIKIFNNKNKINAIVKLWADRNKFRDGYYRLSGVGEKLEYLASLPHIGKITRNHLARNLGEDVFKRDVWIERLLIKFGGDLLERLSRETGLPVGYVDVILWKSCQVGLIDL